MASAAATKTSIADTAIVVVVLEVVLDVVEVEARVALVDLESAQLVPSTDAASTAHVK